MSRMVLQFWQTRQFPGAGGRNGPRFLGDSHMKLLGWIRFWLKVLNKACPAQVRWEIG